MKLLSMLILSTVPLRLMAQSSTMESATDIGSDWWAQEVIAESLSLTNTRPVTLGADYSGIAVQLIQAEQPLQLLNPYAPRSYGNGDQNVVFDPFSQRPSGLKLFSLNF